MRTPKPTADLTPYLPLGAATGLKLSRPVADKEEDAAQLRERHACRKFEGFLLGEMLKQMRNPDGLSGGLIPASRAERMFIGQQCEALGDLLAAQEPLGLARLLRSNIHSTRPATGPRTGPALAGLNGGGEDAD